MEKKKLTEQLDRKIAEAHELSSNLGQQHNIVEMVLKRLPILKNYFSIMASQDPKLVNEYYKIMHLLYEKKSKFEIEKSNEENKQRDKLESTLKEIESEHDRKIIEMERNFLERMKEKKTELRKVSEDLESLQNYIIHEKRIYELEDKQIQSSITQFADLKKEILEINATYVKQNKELQRSIAKLDRRYQGQQI